MSLQNEWQAKDAFVRARSIPYRIPLSFDEPNQSCVGKHQQFKDEIETLGYQTRWVEVAFRWSDLPIPKEILVIPHDDETTHAYLEILIDGNWLVVDLTWDEGLVFVLPVNEWTDFGNMKIAVPVIRRIPEEQMWIHRERSTEEEREEFQRNKDFFAAVNEWLEIIRK